MYIHESKKTQFKLISSLMGSHSNCISKIDSLRFTILDGTNRGVVTGRWRIRFGLVILPIVHGRVRRDA